MKGTQRLRPPRKDLVPRWQLSVVLDTLTRPPFKPLHSGEVKFLSLETALLLTITSTKLVERSLVSLATSWALFQGASVTDICNAAVWATPHTFTRFYQLSIVDQ